MKRKTFWLLFHYSRGRNGPYILIWRAGANDATAGRLLVSGVIRADGRAGQVQTHRMTGVGVGVGRFWGVKFEPIGTPGDVGVDGVEGCCCTCAGGPVADGC